MMAEILGMASDMPAAPMIMMTGMIQPLGNGSWNRPRSTVMAGNQSGGASTCSTSGAPNSSIPVASTRTSPKRRASLPVKTPWLRAETMPTIMKLRPTSRAPQS